MATIDKREQHAKDLLSCVHCGLCLNACPTYLETGSEADSPRGRIVLMRQMHEGTLSPHDDDVVEHIDRCLGCRACETACPSGVPYGNILEVARDRIEESRVRPTSVSLARKALLKTLTNPTALCLSMHAASRFTKGRVPAQAVSLISGRTDGAVSQNLYMGEGITDASPPSLIPSVGVRRYRVAVLSGCAMRVLFGETNAATNRVLAANGCDVHVINPQGCCGALHLHNGQGEIGRKLARALVDSFSPLDAYDAIVVNSAGCGSTMKDYGRLLEDDGTYAEKAAEFAAKVKDISEFLHDIGWVAPLKPLGQGDVRVTYHDACHLLHGQHIQEAPRVLLGLIPGVTLVPLDETEICCGSAGIYNLTEPEMAHRLRARKLGNIMRTGASIVATGNPGCLAWIHSGLQEANTSSIRVAHPIALLDEALAGSDD